MPVSSEELWQEYQHWLSDSEQSQDNIVKLEADMQDSAQLCLYATELGLGTSREDVKPQRSDCRRSKQIRSTSNLYRTNGGNIESSFPTQHSLSRFASQAHDQALAHEDSDWRKAAEDELDKARP